jgi:MFS family permease
MGTGFVKNFGSLVVTRILLGFFEGCLFAAMTIFLVNWYKREELGLRIAFLFGKSDCRSKRVVFKILTAI